MTNLHICVNTSVGENCFCFIYLVGIEMSSQMLDFDILKRFKLTFLIHIP